MSETLIKTRIISKHADRHQWENSTFIPLKGEIVVYDYRDEDDVKIQRLKIGDGSTHINDLPFVNPESGDYQLYQNMVQSLDQETTESQYPSANAVKAYVASNTLNCYTTTVTLGNWEREGFSSANGSTYEIAVDGVTATNIVQVSPAPESYEVWAEYGIRCSQQSEGSLRFECPSFGPTESITVNILIFDTFEYGDNKEY